MRSCGIDGCDLIESFSYTHSYTSALITCTIICTPCGHLDVFRCNFRENGEYEAIGATHCRTVQERTHQHASTNHRGSN